VRCISHHVRKNEGTTFQRLEVLAIFYCCSSFYLVPMSSPRTTSPCMHVFVQVPFHQQAFWGLLEAPSVIIICALANYQETGTTNMSLVKVLLLFSLLYTLPCFLLRQHQRQRWAAFCAQQQQQQQQHSSQCKVQPSKGCSSNGSSSSSSSSSHQFLTESPAIHTPPKQHQVRCSTLPAPETATEAPHRQSQSSAQAPAAAPRAACLPGRKKSSVLYRSKVSRSASISIKAS